MSPTPRSRAGSCQRRYASLFSSGSGAIRCDAVIQLSTRAPGVLFRRASARRTAAASDLSCRCKRALLSNSQCVNMWQDSNRPVTAGPPVGNRSSGSHIAGLWVLVDQPAATARRRRPRWCRSCAVGGTDCAYAPPAPAGAQESARARGPYIWAALDLSTRCRRTRGAPRLRPALPREDHDARPRRRAVGRRS